MHKALADIVTRLDLTRDDLSVALDSIPPAARETRPGPERWSAAEIVEHLALVEDRYRSIVAESLASVPRRTHPAVRTPLPEQLATMMANRSARRPAPDGFIPTGLPFNAAWAKAVKTRDAFHALLVSADSLALEQTAYDHPRFGTLNAYQWVEFVTAHERRHIEQIRENAAELHGAAQR